MEQKPKNILLLAHRFYDDNSPGALRRRYFAQAALAHFNRVVVLEGNGPKSGLPAWPNNFRYEQVDYQDARKLVRGQRKTETTANKANLGLARKIFHSFPFTSWLGDGGPAYLRKAFQIAARLIEEEQIDYLFASYRPWADQLLAQQLKRRFPHLVWIADFRDLHADPIRKDVLWPALQRRWGRRILAKADVVTTVSEGLARQLHRLHPQVRVLRNAIPSLPNLIPTAPMGPKFQISYTGSLYPQLQSAQMLFDIIRDLSRVETAIINPARFELIYAGKDGEVWESWTRKAGISHLSRNLGILSLEQVAAVQRESQFNMLLTWSAPGYFGILTAKLYDYMASGRPIIALVNGPLDPELNQIITETATGRLFSTHSANDKEAVRQWILEAYQTWQFVGAFPWAARHDKLRPYTWPQQMAQFVNLLPKSVSRQ